MVTVQQAIGGRADKSALILAGFSGLLQVLLFPSPSQYWLCWVALVPLIVALVNTAQKKLSASFLVAYVSGIIWYLGSCEWMVHVMNTYGGLPLPVSVGILFLFTLYVSLFHGLLGIFFALCSRRFGSSIAVLLIPVFWTAMELTRGRIMGFPWNPLGNTQVDNVPFGRLAMVTGVFGMSFVIAAVNALFALAWIQSGYRAISAVCAVLLASGIECGNLVHVPAEVPSQSAVLMQGNLQIDAEWTQDYYNKTIQGLIDSSVAQSHDAAMVVWPEEPAPFQESDPHFQSAMAEMAHRSRAYLILGNLTFEPNGTPNGYYMFNSASLMNPQGHFVARYDKIHLVPWGEYVPYQDLFWFAHKLTREVGSFSPGKARNVFDLGGHKVGTVICYEAVFGNEVREFANLGAEVLVNISDDAWFGDYGAPWQHFNIVRMRAIENHRWLLRDTNSGITASIDPEGRVVAELPRNRYATLKAPFAYVQETTFYTRHGDVFAFSCAIITLAGVGLALLPHGKVA